MRLVLFVISAALILTVLTACTTVPHRVRVVNCKEIVEGIYECDEIPNDRMHTWGR
jgi:hypothetical protein